MEIKASLSQIILLSLIAFSIYTFAKIGLDYRAKSAERLEHVWREDIQNLQHAHKLPASWDDISQVEKIPGLQDAEAASWVKSVSSPIQINPSGKYKLEILFLSQNDNGHKRAVIQHHMIHIPSGNSVWELGRTYTLN